MDERTDTGTYAQLVAKRQAMVEHMTPAARAANFPTLYAKPLPVDHTSAASRQMIIDLKAKNAELRAVIVALKKDNERLILDNAEFSRPIGSLIPRSVRFSSLDDVVDAFCRTLEAAGYRIGGVVCTRDDLTGKSKARKYSEPRQVAMWLCRKLCSPKRASTPIIGRAFGNRDHTTVMHACDRAPLITQNNHMLRAVACAVLAAFEQKVST